MPLRALAPLAGVAVLPGLGGGNAQIAHLAAVLERAHLGITAEIADDDYLVDGPGHSVPSCRLRMVFARLHHRIAMKERLKIAASRRFPACAL